MIYDKCGAEIPDISDFCPNCGTKAPVNTLIISNPNDEDVVNGVNPAEKRNVVNEKPSQGFKKRKILIPVFSILAIALIATIILGLFSNNNDILPEKSQTTQQPHPTEQVQSTVTESVPSVETEEKIVVPSLSAGEVITLGSYEQDNNLENGKEPVDWIVLAKEDDKMLVVSKFCLDCQPYNNQGGGADWESCSLRNWLNDDFMRETFSDTEQEAIILSAVKNPGLYWGVDEDGCWIATNSQENTAELIYEVPNGNATEDYLFLLNLDEANTFLSLVEGKAACLTEYAKEAFIQTSIVEEGNGIDAAYIKKRYQELEKEYGNGFCYWWLRTPGMGQDTASVISYENAESAIQYTHCVAGLRPAMWLRIG